MWKNSVCIWFCTQNHILEPFSVRRACTKSYVTSEPYPRASQIWCQNVRETWKKKVIKCRGESFARCRVIARNVEGGPFRPPPPPRVFLGLNCPVFIKLLPAQNSESDIIIATNGGRYDVSLSHRLRYAIYWDEQPSPVRRCTWFYKSDSENRFIPYEEQMANILEVSKNLPSTLVWKCFIVNTKISSSSFFFFGGGPKFDYLWCVITVPV